jgi:polyisoprenoid-binding protein YceI
MRLRIGHFLLVLGAVALSSAALADSFVLDPTSQHDSVSFASEATLELVEGQSTHIIGYFDIDPSDPNNSASGRLKSDLREIQTGIALRDRHLRERHLETDDYPFAYFELTSAKGFGGGLPTDSVVSGTVSGYLYLHGVKRRIDAPVKVRRYVASSGSWAVRVDVEFTIPLEDYDIKRPRALFLKLAETITINVSFTGLGSLTPPEIPLPVWPERR